MGEVEREEGRRAQALQSPAGSVTPVGRHTPMPTVPQYPRLPELSLVCIFLCAATGERRWVGQGRKCKALLNHDIAHVFPRLSITWEQQSGSHCQITGSSKE